MPYLSHSSEVASMVLEKVTDEGNGNFMQIVRIYSYVASCVPCIARFILYGHVQVHVHV